LEIRTTSWQGTHRPPVARVARWALGPPGRTLRSVIHAWRAAWRPRPARPAVVVGVGCRRYTSAQAIPASGLGQPAQPMTKEREQPARATARTVLLHYLHRLRTSRAGGRSLAERFFRCMGQEHSAEQAFARYLELLAAVTLPEARSLSDPRERSVLRLALGIESSADLYACAAVLLFQRDNRDSRTPTWGLDLALPQKGSETGGDRARSQRSGPATAARRKLLPHLRFHLMRRQELGFLASARLTGAKDPKSFLEGHGSARIGVYGYTHFARETMFFAMLGQMLGGEALDEMAQLLATGAHSAALRLNQPDNALFPVFEGIIRPLRTELGFLLRRQGYWPPESLNVGDPSDLVDGGVNLERYRQRMETGAQDTAEAEAGDASDTDWTDLEGDHGEAGDSPDPFEDDADRDEPDPTIGRDFRRHKEVLQRRLETYRAEQERLAALPEDEVSELRRDLIAAGIARAAEGIRWANFILEYIRHSASLFEADPEVYELLPKLQRVVQLVEASDAEFRAGGLSTPFRNILRLHLAFQLMTYFMQTKYTANDREAVVEGLSRVFRCDDPDTGDALRVFAEIQSTTLWDESYRKLLRSFAEAAVAAAGGEPEGSVAGDARALLSTLKTIGPALESVRIPRVGPEGWEIDLYCWAFEIQAKLAQAPSLADAAFLGHLEALLRLLFGNFMGRPVDHLNACLDRLAPTLGERVRCTTGRLAELERVEDVIGRSATRVDWALGNLALELVEATRAPDVQEPLGLASLSTELEGVLKFFTQKWARTQQKEKQRQRWVYRAFKLCHSGVAAPYERLYRRVLEAELPVAGSEAREAYSPLLELEGFPEAFVEAVLQRLRGETEGSGHAT